MTGTRHRRRIATAGAVVAVIGAASGCSAVSGGSQSNTSATSGSQADTIKKITYVNPLPSYPAFNVAGACFAKQAKAYGWTPTQLGITGTTVDNQGSINQISQAVVSGADAIVAFPIVPQQFTPVIKQARQKGIVVVAVNSGDPSTGQQAQVGTDQAQMGATIADGIGKADPNAHVGMLSLSASSAPFVQNIAGFKKEAAAKYPDMKVVASEYDNGDATKDPDIFRTMLTAHPDITALYAVEGAAVSGAVTAVREAGKTKSVRVVTLDLTDQTRTLIEQGKLYGVGDQGWCDMGTKAVETVKRIADGQKVATLIPTKVTFYSADNLPAK